MDVGGQAVIEGVMMRNKDRFAVAVRTPDGKIKIWREKSSTYPKMFSVPFIRGVVGLGYALYDGIRALTWSSNQNLGDEEKLSKREMILTIVGSMVFAALFFVVLPFGVAHFLTGSSLLFNVLDGVFRVALFLGYLLLISRMDEVKTLFSYHGAEHKTIYCYESGEKLTVENARRFSRLHPRCGTSFLFFVLVLSIVVFSFITGAWWVKLGGRLLLMPVIASLAYEIIKLSGRFEKNICVRVLITPGLWLQKITTREPNDMQLEVAIASLKAVVKEK